MTDPVTRAERELDTRLTSHITDDTWRHQLAAAFVRWLIDNGWRPPPDRPDPRAERAHAVPPTEAYRAARQALTSREGSAA